MKPHHAAWLSAHPTRSLRWFRARVRDGFDIHHLDGDKTNNHPANLVMIENADHFMVHNGSRKTVRMSRLERAKAQGIRPKIESVVSLSQEGIARKMGVSLEQLAEWQSKSRIL
jgi:DNA-binding transcriptional regulator YiaG